jgi:hypothetical protein
MAAEPAAASESGDTIEVLKIKNFNAISKKNLSPSLGKQFINSLNLSLIKLFPAVHVELEA